MFNFYKKNDNQIQRDVVHELRWDPSVTDSQITVASQDGVITLRGRVPHYFERSMAEEAAERVGGVRAVANEIEVDLMGSYEKTDTEIAAAALNALEWSYAAPKGIKVSIENGWITLKGEADWDYERTAAKNAVSSLMGVRGVSNNIVIKEKVLIADVKSHIEQALKRSAEAEGRQIDVKVNRDQVTLSGKVHSFAEMADAGLAAWNAGGVKWVENKISISQ